MDRKNLDARDLAAMGLDPAGPDPAPAAVPSEPPPPPVDPRLPKTLEELTAVIEAEVKRFLSTVPRGEE